MNRQTGKEIHVNLVKHHVLINNLRLMSLEQISI